MENNLREPFLKPKDVIIFLYFDVNPSMSNDLLSKFPNTIDFDYSQSAIWSPLVQPKFPSLKFPCLNFNSPELKKRKLNFDDDFDGCKVFGKVRFSGIKRKVRAFGLKLNDKINRKNDMKKLLKFDSGDFNCQVSDVLQRSPPSDRKGWKKALKMTSRQFKKKRDHQIKHHHPISRITLADYLQCQNF